VPAAGVRRVPIEGFFALGSPRRATGCTPDPRTAPPRSAPGPWPGRAAAARGRCDDVWRVALAGEDALGRAGEAGQLQAARLLDRPAPQEASSARGPKHQTDRGSGDDQLPGGCATGRDEARGRPRHPPGGGGSKRPGQDDDRRVPRHHLQRRFKLTEEGEDEQCPLRAHRRL